MKKILILFLAIGFYSNAQYNYNYNYNDLILEDLYYLNNLNNINNYQRQIIIITEPAYNYNYNLLYTEPLPTLYAQPKRNRCNR